MKKDELPIAGSKNDSVDAAVWPDVSEMFQLVLDAFPVRVFWKDRQLINRGSNALFARDAGVPSPEDLIGRSDYEMGWTVEQAQAFRKDDLLVIASGEAKLGIEEPQNHPDGKTHWLETNKVPLKAPDGTVIGVLGTYTDITERKEQQQRIAFLANHDELTGLPNRRSLRTSIQNYEAQGSGSKWAGLLFIDLDQFKVVNDSLGHAVGDKLLCEVASRLSELLGGSFQLSRLGGDEFAIFMPNFADCEKSAHAESSMLADRIIGAFSEPFDIYPHCVYVGASIGISLSPPGTPDLVNNFGEADIAMYEAKARGHNSYLFFDASMKLAASRRHELQNRLRQSDWETGFALVYQPQYDSAERLVGCEALLRWNDAELGPVPPGQFVPLAEQAGLIHRIGEWVLREGFAQFAAWQRGGLLPQPFHLAVNVSTVQFQNSNFVGRVKALAAEHGISPDNIEIEITETQPIEQSPAITKALNELTSLGFKLVIDDFGTGYSSISYLARMELTKLKIDRSIVNGLSENARHKAIAQSIIQLSNNLDVTVIAEGVETREDRDALIDLECEYFQGFLYDKGCPPEEFEAKHLSKR